MRNGDAAAEGTDAQYSAACIGCGYSLTGLPDRSGGPLVRWPECGREHRPGEQPRPVWLQSPPAYAVVAAGVLTFVAIALAADNGDLAWIVAAVIGAWSATCGLLFCPRTARDQLILLWRIALPTAAIAAGSVIMHPSADPLDRYLFRVFLGGVAAAALVAGVRSIPRGRRAEAVVLLVSLCAVAPGAAIIFSTVHMGDRPAPGWTPWADYHSVRMPWRRSVILPVGRRLFIVGTVLLLITAGAAISRMRRARRLKIPFDSSLAEAGARA